MWIPAAGETLDLSDRTGPWWVNGAEVEGLGDPEEIPFTRKQSVIDGQRYSGSRTGERQAFLPIVLNAAPATWQSIQARFWAAFVPGVYGTLRWFAPDGTYRDLRCRYQPDGNYKPGRDPSLSGVEIVGIPLIADDTWWRGPENIVPFGPAGDVRPLYSTDPSYLLYFMPSNTAATATIDNPGDKPMWLRYRFDGPISSFRISDPDGTDYLAGAIDIAAGGWLDIDTRPDRQTVLYTDPTGVRTSKFISLTAANYRAIEKGTSMPLNITTIGAGTVTVTTQPLYRRAY